MNLISHRQLVEKYRYDISIITGLDRAIQIIQNEVEDEWETESEFLGFFDLKEAYCEYQEKQKEIKLMVNRLERLQEKLDDCVGDEYNGAWYADAELYNFFLTAFGERNRYTSLYKGRLYRYNSSRQSRESRQYHKWRVRAIMRDGGACRICGELNGLEVHHLFSWSHYPIYRLAKENGVTLCKCCHDDFHINFMGGFENPCTLYDYVQWATYS